MLIWERGKKVKKIMKLVLLSKEWTDRVMIENPSFYDWDQSLDISFHSTIYEVMLGSPKYLILILNSWLTSFIFSKYFESNKDSNTIFLLHRQI